MAFQTEAGGRVTARAFAAEQLAGQGVYIKSGEVSIVDAGVIAAKQSRPKQGKDGQNTQDPEARWSVEVGSDGKRKNTDGYKAHDNVDEAGFIKATDYSAGSLHDSNCFTGLLTGEESKVRSTLKSYRNVALRIAASNGRTGIDRWAKKINNLTGYPQAREAPWSVCLVYSSNTRGWRKPVTWK